VSTREAWIVAAARTPIGRHGGALARIRPDDLAAIAVRAVIDRAGIDPARVDDVILGCANQAGEDNRNVARMAALLAGLPVSVPGQTVNRLCGSGMQAVVAALHAILAGEGDVFVAGGVESMSRAPYVMLKPEEGFARGAPEVADTVLGWRFINPRFPAHYTMQLGQTAEVVAGRYGISREAQDEFALASQHRAADAMSSGHFADELIPVEIAQRRGATVQVTEDEHPRPGTTLEQLSRLKPAFQAEGTVTAGNSSGLNDGAAALLVMSGEAVAAAGLEPLARIVATGAAGVAPDEMGMGPVPASRRALARAGITAAEVARAEVNEAFAAQAVPCIRELDLDPSRVNVNGGAIALGHPLGCSGARILTTLVHELRRSGGGYGLATMCIGVGQGIATVLEVNA
jgi:3-oxoadipyl-CoA thiolase